MGRGRTTGTDEPRGQRMMAGLVWASGTGISCSDPFLDAELSLPNSVLMAASEKRPGCRRAPSRRRQYRMNGRPMNSTGRRRLR